MALTKAELFEKLLEQIKWQPSESEQSYFEGAVIDKVVVHTKSRRWDFYIGLEAVLPYATFIDLKNHIELAFKEIASVSLAFRTNSEQLEAGKLGDYWQWVAQNSGLNSPLQVSLAKNKPPYVDGKRVVLLAENELLQNFLKNEALGKIEATYQNLGFPSLI